MRPHLASPASRRLVHESGTVPVMALCNFRTAGRRGASNAEKCDRIVHADVVALDQCITLNRFGTVLPDGMIFAVRRDVISNTDPSSKNLTAGNVMLRPGKRPRPIVLRANEGDCLEIAFTNLLNKSKTTPVFTRTASVHVQGLEVVDSLNDDGAWVGKNGSAANNGLAATGESKTYLPLRPGGSVLPL